MESTLTRNTDIIDHRAQLAPVFIDIDEKYWGKLRAMIDYVRAYIRPDGYAPLLGDSDSGQLLPVVRRRGDDHSYLPAVGAAVFQEPRFKIRGTEMQELLWILGENGVHD